jgi:hypothetical protein
MYFLGFPRATFSSANLAFSFLIPSKSRSVLLLIKLETLAIPSLSAATPVHSRFELAQMYSPRLSVVYYSFGHPDTVDKGI